MPFIKGHSGMEGRKMTEETKAKIGRSNSIALRGKKLSEETKNKIRAAHLARREKSHLWKGGISKKPGYRSFITKRRLLRIKKNGGNFTFLEWVEIKEKFDFTCLGCGKKEPEIKLTIDHIVPISKGGVDSKENIQPLCGLCNNRKYMKIDDLRDTVFF